MTRSASSTSHPSLNRGASLQRHAATGRVTTAATRRRSGAPLSAAAQGNHRTTLILVYSPTCPYCVAMQAEWAAVKRALQDIMPVKDYDINTLNQYANRGDPHKHLAAVNTTSVPHIFMSSPSGGVLATHHGTRDRESMLAFVRDALQAAIRR